jgi:Na+/H+-dicarboxylate symporter
MELISKLIPHFIFIVLIQMIWSDTLDVVLSSWKPFLIFIACVIVISLAMALIAALKTKSNFVMLVKKAIPASVIAITTASSVAAFGTCVSTCEKKLGISNSITSFGVPLGIVIFPPGIAIYFTLICIYTAEVYNVECSLTWFVMAIFTGCLLAIAAPPIPGGTLTCYTIMFSQLGLPEEALVVALALDILFDFIATGMNVFCLQMELLLQAKKMGRLNEKTLKSAA